MDLPVTDPRLNQDRLDFLKETLGIRKGKAEAYLLSRRGYSSSGIAHRIGSTDSTVKKYLDELEDEFGAEAVYPCYGEDTMLSPLPDGEENQENFDNN